MAELVAQADRAIAAPAQAVYAAVSDYDGTRRRILPEAYHDYGVEHDAEGNLLVRWVLHVGNHRRPYTMRVTRDDAGTRLVEQDTGSSFTTTWVVRPEQAGSRVRLVSRWQQRSHGVPAIFERLFAPRSLARLHAETLRRLSEEFGPTAG